MTDTGDMTVPRRRPPTATEPRVLLSRRRLLQLSASGLLLAGCGAVGGESEPGSTEATWPDPEVSPSAAPTVQPVPETDPEPEDTTVPPVDVQPYTVLPGEMEPECKTAAVRSLETALTWRDGETGMQAAVDRLAALGITGAATTTLTPALVGERWSSLRVTYPQYGGMLPDRSQASVMVTGTQIVPQDGEAKERGLIVDVRLAKQDGTWTVTEMLLPQRPEPTGPTAAGQAVIDHDNIILPDPARRDIEARLVDDLVCELLLTLAETWRLDVQVLNSGHPWDVFMTGRQSNHTKGRAVDLWALNGIPVIDHENSPWREVMEAAVAAGAGQAGGPEDLDGVRGRRPYFTDAVHQDHLHLGFTDDQFDPTPTTTAPPVDG